MNAARTAADLLQPANGWATATPQRLTPPPPAQRGLLFRTLSLGSRHFRRARVPDIFPVLNIHRGLFLAWLWFASRLMPYGRLRGRTRELLILRTAWNCRSRYEWGQHVEIGLAAGLSDEEIAGIAKGPEAFADPYRRALLAACDELCRDNLIAADTWAALGKEHDDAERIEIALLVGHYRMLAGFLNSAGIPLEPDIEATLQAFHRRIAP